MKTNGPSSAQRTGYCSAQKGSGISSEKLPSLGQQQNFKSQTHTKIKWIFLQLGKCDILQGKKNLFFHRSSENNIKTFQSSFLVGFEVSECLGWPSYIRCVPRDSWFTRWEEDQQGEYSTTGLSAPPDLQLYCLKALTLSFKHSMSLIPEHLHLSCELRPLCSCLVDEWRGAFQRKERKGHTLVRMNRGQTGLEA